jgi:ATP-dependent DNA helicase RecG
MNPQLEAFLTAVGAPLDFLANAGPEAAARTKLPVEALIERARRLGLTQTPALREEFEALQRGLRELEHAAPATRLKTAEHCRAIVERIRGGLLRPSTPYRPTPGPLEPLLEFLAQSVQFAKGVGPRRADLFRKAGLRVIEDLLYHLPFRYEDRREIRTIAALRVGEEATVIGTLAHLAERFAGRSRRRILEGAVRDETGILPLTWYNQVAFFRARYQIGTRYVVSGKVEVGLGSNRRMVHPEVEPFGEGEVRGIVPVYGKPTSVTVAAMRKLVQATVREVVDRVPSVLPATVARAHGLLDLGESLRRVHAPDDAEDIGALNDFTSTAHRSLVFDELFFLQLGMLLRRRSTAAEAGLTLVRNGTLTDRLRQVLPFRFTGAQDRVLEEICGDMARPRPMHRLVQGDVGSGKTVVALAAALVAVENQHQAAFMAPTELLAEQHFHTLAPLAEKLGLSIALLTGDTKGGERASIYARLAEGSLPIVVGTQALIQEKVRFQRLGLGVIDEQHRFGVLQRAALRSIGHPDILLMTATPIPRTLALTLYADLDLSFLDELPPGRTPVRTLLFHENRRQQVYDLVRIELDKGRQGYVVYPLVEESDDPALRDATTMARELARTVFANYRVGLIHGRMKADEKEAVMRRFKAGDLQLLVSTTVIEVGIDVPNATVIVIEHAERFGLAQLHQLRGRVGRGAEASSCVLVASFAQGDEAKERLQAMVDSRDGFQIAEVDLRLRGPGDFLGTRQSGLPDFRVANLIRDSRILEEARRAAQEWLEKDPDLASPESKLLRAVLAHRWAGRLELATTG